MPFDTDPDYPQRLQIALSEFRGTWRDKMDAVNAVIAASAQQDELVDQPIIDRKILRVSGPFTVEGVMPVESTISIEEESPIEGIEEELETFGVGGEDTVATYTEPAITVNADAYHSRMLQLLKADGVRFPDNKVMKFTRLEALTGSVLHAEGEWGDNGDAACVAIVFGPQIGPLTAQMVEDCLTTAYRKRIYTDLVFAAFSFDAAAQSIIQEDINPKVHCHLAHIRPDVQMGDLLKTTNNSQLFTVFGLPRVEKTRLSNGEWVVEMEGVDIYDPVEATLRSTKAEKVAAWFLDSDYDGACFCVTQAFFPDPKAWEKLSKALDKVVDASRFAAFSGTKSLPFPAGKYKRAAVKVIDPRGNEVLRVISLTAETTY